MHQLSIHKNYELCLAVQLQSLHTMYLNENRAHMKHISR